MTAIYRLIASMASCVANAWLDCMEVSWVFEAALYVIAILLVGFSVLFWLATLSLVY